MTNIIKLPTANIRLDDDAEADGLSLHFVEQPFSNHRMSVISDQASDKILVTEYRWESCTMNTEHLVCTLVDEMTKEMICQYFPLTRVTAYMSSTASTQAFHQYAAVVASSVLDARLLPCYHANGYPLLMR